MASYKPFSSALKSATVMDKSERPNSVVANSNLDGFLGKVAIQQPEPMAVTQDGFIGTLDIHVHHAHDIHNICIYHKQDVYAKLCLTSDPEVTVSTKTINGGGRNPVFDEKLKLHVRTVECSLKCEIWMLSRVKNYLEDQLLGFALVPLSDVVAGNEALTQEFSLSSTDLFHSPAGFVQISVSYTGYSPKVMAIATPLSSDCTDTNLPDSENDVNFPCEFVKIEFPDLKVVNENKLMVSEYLGIPCDNLEPEGSESLITCENDVSPDLNAGVHILESIASGGVGAIGALNTDTPSCASDNSSPATIPATSQASSASGITESQTQKTKNGESADSEAESSSSQTSSAFTSPFIIMEPEQTVVQQDIVDMYMKSMQQFTESLAKMKLPMDIENSSSNLQNTNSGSEQEVQATKRTGSRVFYGSRAFF